jgi:hypothetical protein
MPTATFGLACHALVRWLIDRDSGVRDAIQKFIVEGGSDFLEVAGPPTLDQIIKRHRDPRLRISLPCIGLRLKRVKHHLTDELGIEVRCKEADLVEIMRWKREVNAYAPQRKAS